MVAIASNNHRNITNNRIILRYTTNRTGLKQQWWPTILVQMHQTFWLVVAKKLFDLHDRFETFRNKSNLMERIGTQHA